MRLESRFWNEAKKEIDRSLPTKKEKNNHPTLKTFKCTAVGHFVISGFTVLHNPLTVHGTFLLLLNALFDAVKDFCTLCAVVRYSGALTYRS